MNIWLLFLCCGMVTFFSRGSFVLFGEKAKIPETVQRALAYVAPAAFAAIAIPATLGAGRFENLAPPSPEVVAAVLAGVAIYKTRNMPLALVVGMVCLWVLQWVGL